MVWSLDSSKTCCRENQCTVYGVKCKPCAKRLLRKAFAEPLRQYTVVSFAFTISPLSATPHYLRYLINSKEKVAFHLHKMFSALEIMDSYSMAPKGKVIKLGLTGTITRVIDRLSISRKGIESLIEMEDGELFQKVLFENSDSIQDHNNDCIAAYDLDQLTLKTENLDSNYKLQRQLMSTTMAHFCWCHKRYYERKCIKKLKKTTGRIRGNWLWIQKRLKSPPVNLLNLLNEEWTIDEMKANFAETKAAWRDHEICGNRDCKKRRGNGVKLKICKGCKFMTYCSRRCQKID